MDQSSISSLSRLIGYGILILSLFDIIHILVPLELMDPLWRFETLGQFVDRVPVLLIGVFLIFYGSRDWLEKWEKLLPNIISWAALLAGIGYLLFVPLGVFSTFQIDQSSDNQLKQQIAQNKTEIGSIREELKQVNTEAQMQALLNRIEGLPPEIKQSQQLGESKQKLTDLITKGAEKLANQLNQTYFQKRLQLMKQSVRWNLGSLVSGVLFIMIWQMTEWVRLIDIGNLEND